MTKSYAKAEKENEKNLEKIRKMKTKKFRKIQIEKILINSKMTKK